MMCFSASNLTDATTGKSINLLSFEQKLSIALHRCIAIVLIGFPVISNTRKALNPLSVWHEQKALSRSILLLSQVLAIASS